LCALRDGFRARGQWSEKPDGADVVLFDSFNCAAEVVAWKRRLPGTPFVHRINGPISIYRGQDLHVDKLIHALAESIADGVVFQSRYSREANLRLGMSEPCRSTVILNAPDPSLFHDEGRVPSADRRVRIVATSWSSNWNKGFEVYRHLDETLDFARYSLTFVGNSPVAFRNIRQLPPQAPAKVAAILRDADVFLTASRDDPCSNSLAEAIACGLVPVAHRSGGHPELVAGAGVLFAGMDDVRMAIDAASGNLDRFRAVLPRRSADQMVEEYAAFLTEVWREARPPSRLSGAAAFGLRRHLANVWVRGKTSGLARRLCRVTRK
jgi:glycosyltransferase involved in cell wall biosynthesis